MGFRKGQITVYMIIGIIALVSVSIFFYIRSAVVEAPQSYAPTIEQIPFEAEPIRNFVSSCVSQVAETGLNRLGTTEDTQMKMQYQEASMLLTLLLAA